MEINKKNCKILNAALAYLANDMCLDTTASRDTN